MVELCNVVPSLGRYICVFESLSVASVSFGLLSSFYNQNRQTADGSCPVLDDTSRTLIHTGLFGIGVSSLVFTGLQLVK